MGTKRSFDDWTPAQDKQAESKDFRALKTGPKGYKERNKRKIEDAMQEGLQQDEDMAVDAAPAVDEDAMEDDSLQQSSKRRKAEGKQYIPVRGRKSLLLWLVLMQDLCNLRSHSE